jgi:hypothetical protein
MGAKGRPKRIYNPAFRPIEFWDGLRTKGFVAHEEWLATYKLLDEPRDRMAALLKLLEYGLPKPRIEDFEEPDQESLVDVENSYRLLKELTQAKIEKECLATSHKLLESSQPSSLPESHGVFSLHGSKESNGT